MTPTEELRTTRLSASHGSFQDACEVRQLGISYEGSFLLMKVPHPRSANFLWNLCALGSAAPRSGIREQTSFQIRSVVSARVSGWWCWRAAPCSFRGAAKLSRDRVECFGESVLRSAAPLPARADSFLAPPPALPLRRSFMRWAFTERDRAYASGCTGATCTRNPLPCSSLPQCLQRLFLNSRGFLFGFLPQWCL